MNSACCMRTGLVTLMSKYMRVRRFRRLLVKERKYLYQRGRKKWYSQSMDFFVILIISSFLFVIDIDSCPEKDYAIIESKYSYTQIESVKEGLVVY